MGCVHLAYFITDNSNTQLSATGILYRQVTFGEMMIVPAVVQHADMDLFKIFSLKPTVDQTTIYPTWDKRANHYIENLWF
jgi:hypothetical protein